MRTSLIVKVETKSSLPHSEAQGFLALGFLALRYRLLKNYQLTRIKHNKKIYILFMVGKVLSAVYPFT